MDANALPQHSHSANTISGQPPTLDSMCLNISPETKHRFKIGVGILGGISAIASSAPKLVDIDAAENLAKQFGRFGKAIFDETGMASMRIVPGLAVAAGASAIAYASYLWYVGPKKTDAGAVEAHALEEVVVGRERELPALPPAPAAAYLSNH